MDVESKQTIDEAVDRLKAAGDELVDRAVLQLHGTLAPLTVQVNDAVTGLLNTALKLSADFQKTIAGLDGWTLEIEFQPIVIPSVTIRLSKPVDATKSVYVSK